LSDWSNSFEREYPKLFAHHLKRELSKILGKTPWIDIEHFGGPKKNGSCTLKLSDQIASVFGNPAFMEPLMYLEQESRVGLEFSKKNNGGSMLQHIDSANVTRSCRSYFSHTYNELVGLQ
jgi:hypothetical protein